jgi:oligopeptide/dipeptide ABC transporter ATP-binding protein
MTVGQIVGQGLLIQDELGGDERREAVQRALELVGLEPALVDRRPGQISGGQRQRVAIARAVVMRPRLLICDEPVSALDASTRNLVLGILADLRRELGLALLIISHDLASLAGVADRVAVLYQGHVVEEGPLEQIFTSARHPYAALLVSSAPSLARGGARSVDLAAFGRDDDDAEPVASGCPFAPRCPYATAHCRTSAPAQVEIESRWTVACHRADEWWVDEETTIPSSAAVASSAAR